MKKQISNYKFRRGINRNYKLSFFREWCLRRRGKRDCKKNIIRKDKIGAYYSPYFEQEMQLCSAEIQNELEILSEIKLKINSKVERAEYMCKIKMNQAKKIEEYLKNDDISEALLRDKEDEFYCLSEKTAVYMAKSKQIDSLMRTMESLNSQKRESNFIIQKETDITYLRCRYLYDILISRLSAYWRGALSVNKKSEDFPPVFDVSNTVSSIERKINTIKDIGEIYE